jgi:hypothetical protein
MVLLRSKYTCRETMLSFLNAVRFLIFISRRHSLHCDNYSFGSSALYDGNTGRVINNYNLHRVIFLLKKPTELMCVAEKLIICVKTLYKTTPSIEQLYIINNQLKIRDNFFYLSSRKTSLLV